MLRVASDLSQILLIFQELQQTAQLSPADLVRAKLNLTLAFIRKDKQRYRPDSKIQRADSAETSGACLSELRTCFCHSQGL